MSKANISKRAASVAALEAGIKPADDIAKAANVSRATIYNWKREANSNQALADAIQVKRTELAAKMERLAGSIADKLLSDVESASWDNKAGTVLGIVTDKWLALTGQPSQITETRVSGSISLVAEARQALQMYVTEGFSAEEAMTALQEDDSELYRALLSASHQGQTIDATPLPDGE